MKSKILFPNHFKQIGWMILIPSAIIGFLELFGILKFKFLDNVKMFAIYSDGVIGDNAVFGYVKGNVSNELFGILCIIGFILVAFSKEKHEDEFIANIRMESLVWATYINYAILILCMLFFYSSGFLYVMIFNMFTILLFFIVRFYYLLHKSNKSMSHEK